MGKEILNVLNLVQIQLAKCGGKYHMDQRSTESKKAIGEISGICVPSWCGGRHFKCMAVKAGTTFFTVSFDYIKI